MTSHTSPGSLAGTVLVVDDDLLLCDVHRTWLEGAGFSVRVAHDGEEALSVLREMLPDTICLDLSMPGMDGFETLERVRMSHPHIPVIVMTAETGAAPAVRAMKMGAYDFLTKPVHRTKFLAEVTNAVRHSQLSLRVVQLERETTGGGYPGIVGSSRRMRDLFARLDRIAASEITVLIKGESGCGKELVAQAVHRQSARSRGPLVAVSCAAIPETLQESELFGHEKGAFTGASSRRLGCFERANHGTLFLDEIGELSASTQARLLRVLQERTFTRVGGSGEIASDFRLIAATLRNLAEDVADGRFREDLYFRVAVMEIDVPPLRERREDIPALARHFLAGQHDGPAVRISDDAMEALQRYDWPGNVRELQNTLEYAVVESGDASISVRHFPRRMVQGARARQPAADGASEMRPAGVQAVNSSAYLPRTLEDMEREAIRASLAHHGGNMARVVAELGIGRTTLYRKMKKYGLR